MATLHTYLNFPGNAEEALNFYKSIFGGEFSSVNRFRDMPPGEHPLPEDAADMMMHISFPIGPNCVLMASDAPPSMGFTVVNGNSNYIMIDASSEAEADRLYAGLSEGGNIEMPLQKTFWGAYYGSFSDKYNIKWMINFDYRSQQ